MEQAKINKIYSETLEIYEAARKSLGEEAHGFRVLYGPLLESTRTLIVGFQPGGDWSHHKHDEHYAPPELNDYLTADWRLAIELRQRFGFEFLQQSVGTNAIFFRAPSIERWRNIPLNTRLSLEAFSLAKMDELIDLINPDQLLILGWDTVELLRQYTFKN
jgi:hypothetical protein